MVGEMSQLSIKHAQSDWSYICNLHSCVFICSGARTQIFNSMSKINWNMKCVVKFCGYEGFEALKIL